MKPWQIVVTVIAVVALGLGAFGTYQSIGLGGRAGDIEDDVSSVEDRADVLEDNVSAIDADIISIETDIGTLQDNLLDVNAEITSIEDNVATVETDISTLQVDLLAINAQITSIQDNIITIETDISTLQGGLSDVNASITSIEGNIVTIQTDISTMQAVVSSLESQVTVPPPESFGPITLDIGTAWDSHFVDIAHPMYRVSFEFHVSGGDVMCLILDPDGMGIAMFWPTDSGAGSFIATTSGTYEFYFEYGGIGPGSTVTLNYTVYPAAPVVSGE